MKQFRHWHEVVLVGLLVALGLFAQVVDPAFLSIRVQSEIAGSIWELAIVAIPVTLIVLTGGIDLSVGAMMSLAAVALGLSFEARLPVALRRA